MSNWRQIVRLSFFFFILSAGGVLAQSVVTIHDFGSRDGQNPQAAVIFDQAGNLYGATALGGRDGNGIAFSLSPPDSGTLWEESLLHHFGVVPDAATPVGPLLFVAPGRLVSTSLEGGTHNMGAVFEVGQSHKDGPWHERVLYSFGSFPTDGIEPNAGLLPANPGFYGVTRGGGDTGRGIVFLLTPPANKSDPWIETILYSFVSLPDAAFPSSELIADEGGNLYGTALQGGVNNLGAVYQLSPPASEGGTWTETVIFSFSGPDGTLPSGRLQFDQSGALYGTTDGGGALQEGTVFRLTPPTAPATSWSEEVLFSFSGGRDGGNPVAGVIIDNQGRLFGTCSTGGSGPLSGGVIFRLDPPANEGDPWTEIVLDSFGGANGFRPVGSLLRRGNAIFGTTTQGGLFTFGTVFMIKP